MFDSAKAQAISSHIVSQKKYLYDAASTYFERFCAFLNTHQPHPEYGIYPGGSIERPEGFILEVSEYSLKTGLAFVGPKPWGDETILMPFEYLDDPDAWESEFLERISKNKELVEETFSDLFGETDLSVYSVGEYRDENNDHVLNVYLTTKGETREWDSYITDICLIFSPASRKFYDTYAHTKVLAGLGEAMTAEDIEEFKRLNTKDLTNP